jgi:hypothetical protein
LDCGHGPFCGRAHAHQDEGGSYRAAECAAKKICETAGNDHGRNASDDSGSNACSQRKPEPDHGCISSGYACSQRKPEPDHGCNSSGYACNQRKSESDGSSHSFSFSRRFAVGFRQNAPVSFARGFPINCAQRNCRAAKYAHTGYIDSAGRHAVSNCICVPHGENPAISARAEAFAVDCAAAVDFCKHASGANPAAHSVSSC